ncbi:MAG: signal peptidase II [Endomicrobiales bacterium]|nr:signal peptidase II [Endomicrobiales bacterium]
MILKLGKFNSLMIAALVIIDQLTKYLIRSSMYIGETREVLPFFQLTYLTNTGVAFSMFQGRNLFFVFFALAVFAGFILWFRKHHAQVSAYLKFAFSLIIAGAAGNFIDRVFLGSVVDFLDFYVNDLHWPAFNVADSCISAGAAMVFLGFITNKKKGVL